MKKFCTLGIIALMNLLLTNSYSFQQNEDIIIYSSSSCGHTQAMVEWLNSKNIPYEFKNVDETFGDNHNEMNELAPIYGYNTFFYYPVMIIKGQLVMRPSTDDVLKALQGIDVQGLEGRMEKHQNWRIPYPKSLYYSFDEVRNRINEGDITIYVDGSNASVKFQKELNDDKIPHKVINAAPGTQEYIKLRNNLDEVSFVKTTYFPVANIKGIWIMDVDMNDIHLMLIQLLGD